MFSKSLLYTYVHVWLQTIKNNPATWTLCCFQFPLFIFKNKILPQKAYLASFSREYITCDWIRNLFSATVL